MANVTLLVGGSTDLSAVERVGRIRGRTREGRSSVCYLFTESCRETDCSGRERGANAAEGLFNVFSGVL